MIKQHLIVLARELNRLPRRWKFARKDRIAKVPAFSLYNWFNRYRKAELPNSTLYGSGPENCGTACCAVGLAASLPYFRKRGLKLVSNTPQFSGLSSWEAVREFFDITQDQALYLFGFNQYTTEEGIDPKAVARRISQFARREAA